MGLAPGCIDAQAKKDSPNILYCLADDWSWGHAGVYGDRVIRTPVFDRISTEGVLFTHAFSAAPARDPGASGDDDRWDTYPYYGPILKR